MKFSNCSRRSQRVATFRKLSMTTHFGCFASFRVVIVIALRSPSCLCQGIEKNLSIFKSSCHLPTYLPHTAEASHSPFYCWSSSGETVDTNFKRIWFDKTGNLTRVCHFSCKRFIYSSDWATSRCVASSINKIKANAKMWTLMNVQISSCLEKRYRIKIWAQQAPLIGTCALLKRTCAPLKCTYALPQCICALL